MGIICIKIHCIFMLFFLCKLIMCQMKMEEPKNGKPGTLSFKPPSLSDDEFNSPWMPENNLKCDGCKIIVYQLHNALRYKIDQRVSLKGNLPESEILDIFDNVCNVYNYEQYGVRTIDGVNHLWGPGLDIYTENHVGIIAGGGKWPRRLKSMCNDFIDHMGEVAIFNEYKSKGASLLVLQKMLCFGKEKYRNGCAEKKTLSPPSTPHHNEL